GSPSVAVRSAATITLRVRCTQQILATTFPVPRCPGLGAYPGWVLTTTSWTVLPAIDDPDLVTLPDTSTSMKAGSGPAGGRALLPGRVTQFCPHFGRLGLFSNPLKLLGAAPPLSVLSFDHWLPQNVTKVPCAAFLFPITKFPPAVTPNAMIVTVC